MKKYKMTYGLVFGLIIALSVVQPSLAYSQTNLVSNISGLAKVTDPNLVNSWGIAHLEKGPWWVADNGMGVATVYNGDGTPFPIGNPLIVTIPGIGDNPSTPTGIVANDGNEFKIKDDHPARFIFATEDGTILAWNRDVDPTDAVLMVNKSPKAVYKGATIAKANRNHHNMKKGENFLYAANFRQARIDVYDTNFDEVKMMPHDFVDNKIPKGFAPFNVQEVDGNLVITYAKQDKFKHDDVAGAGNGFVDIFDPCGKLLMRLEHGDWLNSPWGVTKASADFGKFSNDLLIGNFGSGKIVAYDLHDGKFEGFVKHDDKPIMIDGLWALRFGNDASAGSSDTLFFSAGLNHEQDGLFGTITK